MALNNVIAVILGGGAGARLHPLTQFRAKPAVPLGGKYRLVDVPVSNCINSELHRIYILTQYNSASLNRHITRTYRFGRFTQGFVEVLAAEITPERADWFQGTADAVRQSFHHIDDNRADTILILAGDHLYRMDYRGFIARHHATGADVTVGVTAANERDATGFGLLRIDASGRIVEFREKPKGDELQEMRVDTTILGLDAGEAVHRPYLASMGIYVFRKEVLRRLLLDAEVHADDFGRDVIPQAVRDANVQAYLFDGYWEDIGTIAAFYRANIAMTLPLPPFNFFDAEAPLYTHPRFLPGSKLLDCHIRSSIIAEGSILNGATVVDSVIGIRSRIDHGARLDGVLMMGADYYQTLDEIKALQAQDRPIVGVGSNSHIRHAIIDKNASIGRGCRLLNEGGLVNHDGDGFFVRDGIVIVPKNATLPDGTVI